jgi:hypothetical protein
LVTQRSAEDTIEVESLLLLLDSTGSLVADVTDAVLVTAVAVWDDGVLTTTEMTAAVLPAGRGATAAQVARLPDTLQFHALPPDAETRVKGAGTGSVTTSGRAASEGPLLVTVRV